MHDKSIHFSHQRNLYKDREMTQSKTQQERSDKHIAIIVQAIRLTPDEPGLTRAEYIASLLADSGYTVDLITSRFQHWAKKHRDENVDLSDKPYNVIMLDEPGYKKNVDLKRIKSHKALGENLSKYLQENGGKYSVIWCQIPPNNIAAIAGEYAKNNRIKFVIDVNDLWPEAMKMALNIPIISDIVFSGFSRDAKKAYACVDAIVGTSDEYAAYPEKYINKDYLKETVYVGNMLSAFDSGAAQHINDIEKPDDEFWVTYAGTLGKSYDLSTLVEASVQAQSRLVKAGMADTKIKCKILGDGPDRSKLEMLASASDAPVDFLGYVDYDVMSAYLVKSDILVNSLVKNAPQSIVSKVADYFAAGKPVINSGKSYEFNNMLIRHTCGSNIMPGDALELAERIYYYCKHSDRVKIEGLHSRQLAEKHFDREKTYQKIVELIDKLAFE